MTPAERVKYFRDLWPAACAAKGWKRSDEQRRRGVVLDCMRAVGGPLVTTSDAKFRRDEVTALFCYLEFLAHPADLDRSARWADCQRDYRAYNRARQADWHEQQVYGKGGSRRLQRERFAGRRDAQGEPLEPFDPEEIRKRHLTMASRHQAKQRRFDRYADIAYTWNITIREAMKKDTEDRRGLGGEYRLSDYSTRQHLYS